MYLAPLNYDRFFRKVFSHEHISKRFLEDFLEVEITHIELLKDKHRLTDDSSAVEFDFRCTIGGTDVIIDMQQWHKTDVVQRFYTYHSAGTVLQLEAMPDKKLLPASTDKRARDKDYKLLKPVITLIWMVDDTLRFSENFVGYIMTPELVREFVENAQIWQNPEIVELLKQREKVLKVLKNDAKSLDFLPQNRLVFLFQKNIVKDKTLGKYHRWFRFAEKTGNENNSEADFKEFREDSVFKEIMRLINRKDMNREDLDYMETEAESVEMFQRHLQGERDQARKEGKKEGKEEGKMEGKEEVAVQMMRDGEPDEKIAKYTGLDPRTIQNLRREMGN